MMGKVVGAQTTAAMVLFGEVLSGEEAATHGLAWRCVADDELMSRALAMGARAASVPRELLMRTKATIHDLSSASYDQHQAAMRRELTDQVWSVGQPAFADRLAQLQAKISKG